MADDTLDGVISNIRACIVSNKGPVLLRNLERDYLTLIGDPIPYRKFKYASLEDFLRNAPSLRVCGSGGQSTVEAAVSSSSKHISDMVSKQKSSKKPPVRFSKSYNGSYRGLGSGRGRGSHSTRGSHRDHLPRNPNPPSRDYSAWDQNIRDSRNKTWNQPTRDSVDEESWDDHGDHPPQKRYSPPLQKTTPQGRNFTPLGETNFTVKVHGDERKVTWKNDNEIPPRFQKLREKPISPEPSTSPPNSQVVFEIHCLGTLLAKNFITHLHESFSSKINVSQFFECSGLKLKDIKTKVLENEPYFDPKVPLLIMVGETETIRTSQKIDIIKRDYMDLIYFLRQAFPGTKLILAHLPICICAYQNKIYLERLTSFNELLSKGLQDNLNIFVLSLLNALDKNEFFSCLNEKSMAKADSHITEMGYSTIAKLLITLLEQDFDSSLFLGQTSNSADSASIISPLGPSQLIKAGLAKQRAEKALQHLITTSNLFQPTNNMLLQPSNSILLQPSNNVLLQPSNMLLQPSNVLLQPSNNKANHLAAEFERLTHEDTTPPLLGEPSHTTVNGQIEVTSDSISERRLLEPDEHCLSNNVAKLKSFCAIRGWPEPVYKVNRGPPSQSSYLVSLTVFGEGANSFKINSLPFDHTDIDTLKGFTAKNALDQIFAEESKKVKSDIIISNDKITFCNRIHEIVASTNSGMFADSVEDEYISRHNEKLPSNWLQSVRESPHLVVDEIPTGRVIINTRKPAAESLLVDLNNPPPLPVDSLGNNQDQLEDVHVTHATAITNIHFRVIGKEYSDEYDILLQNMDLYYNGVGKQDLALVIEVGHYYAAHNSDTWFRVRVTEVDEVNKQVVAWLLDLGGSDCFQFGSLYRLLPQFCQLPQQAVLCVLEGLEEFNDDPVANKVVKNSSLLFGKTLIAKVTHKDTENACVTATLFDTSGDDDVDVNLQLKEEILVEQKPLLLPEGSVDNICISHVSKKGEVWITHINLAMERILELLETLGPDKISEHKLTSFKHISLNKMYLAKYSKDEKWYRAIVTDTPSIQQNKIPVRFVDYGNTESVSINCIADLENLPLVLRKLPPQAMQVALHNLPQNSLTNYEIARLNTLLMDEEKSMLVKTVSLKADPPIVEFYTKEADRENAPLESVNKAIELQRDLTRNLSGSDVNYNQLKSGVVLHTPEITPFETQGVTIMLSAHPGHFIFQLHKYYKQLDKMMAQMALYYNSDALPELTEKIVEENKLYAARYLDDMWYRVLVTNTGFSGRVPVRLIDYGDVVCVPFSSMRELPPDFQQLPFMAIKGQLANVQPRHKDWTVEDCMRFKELVVGHPMEGTVVRVEKNEKNPIEMKVTLILVDNNSDNKQNIANVLLFEQRCR